MRDSHDNPSIQWKNNRQRALDIMTEILRLRGYDTKNPYNTNLGLGVLEAELETFPTSLSLEKTTEE